MTSSVRIILAGGLLTAAAAAQEPPKPPERLVFKLQDLAGEMIVSAVDGHPDELVRSVGWSHQARVAAQLYGLTAEQTTKLNNWLSERAAGTSEIWTARDKLVQASDALKGSGVPFDEKAMLEKIAGLQAKLTEYRVATRAGIRERILDDDQRRLFDIVQADGSDPLTGEPADPDLPGHDPAKYEAWREEQSRELRAMVEAGNAARKALKVFSGKGFVEAEWAKWLERTAVAVGMTAEQRTRADRLLNLAAEAAAEHRKAREADYRRIAADLAKLQQGRGDPATRVGVTKAAAELSAPVDAIGKRFRADVAALLDDAQSKKLPKW